MLVTYEAELQVAYEVKNCGELPIQWISVRPKAHSFPQGLAPAAQRGGKLVKYKLNYDRNFNKFITNFYILLIYILIFYYYGVISG